MFSLALERPVLMPTAAASSSRPLMPTLEEVVVALELGSCHPGGRPGSRSWIPASAQLWAFGKQAWGQIIIHLFTCSFVLSLLNKTHGLVVQCLESVTAVQLPELSWYLHQQLFSSCDLGNPMEIRWKRCQLVISGTH